MYKYIIVQYVAWFTSDCSVLWCHFLFCIVGRWYHIKRIVFLCLFKLRQRRKRKEKTLQEGNSGYGVSVTDPEKLEECPPLLNHPHVSY